MFALLCYFFFFKQKTAYEMRISDWSSDVCSSDLDRGQPVEHRRVLRQRVRRIDRPAARCRAMPFGTLRVDPLIEGEAPEHEVEALAADIIAQFLQIGRAHV